MSGSITTPRVASRCQHGGAPTSTFFQPNSSHSPRINFSASAASCLRSSGGTRSRQGSLGKSVNVPSHGLREMRRSCAISFRRPRRSATRRPISLTLIARNRCMYQPITIRCFALHEWTPAPQTSTACSAVLGHRAADVPRRPSERPARQSFLPRVLLMRIFSRSLCAV